MRTRLVRACAAAALLATVAAAPAHAAAPASAGLTERARTAATSPVTARYLPEILGGLIGGVTPFSIWTVIAFLFLAGILYMLFRKNRYDEEHLALRSVQAAAK